MRRADTATPTSTIWTGSDRQWQTYRGNVFSGATCVTGGTADLRNNVESVFLPAGQVAISRRASSHQYRGRWCARQRDPTDQDLPWPSITRSDSGAIVGAVTASGSGDPIVGAKLVASKDVTNTFSVFSGLGGMYTMMCPPAPIAWRLCLGYLSEQRSGGDRDIERHQHANFV